MVLLCISFLAVPLLMMYACYNKQQISEENCGSVPVIVGQDTTGSGRSNYTEDMLKILVT